MTDDRPTRVPPHLMWFELARTTRADRPGHGGYVNDVSTRSVDDLVAALGVDSGIEQSAVSRISAGLDEIVGAYRTRHLDHFEFAYVDLDATHLHVRNSALVAPIAVVASRGQRQSVARPAVGGDLRRPAVQDPTDFLGATPSGGLVAAELADLPHFRASASRHGSTRVFAVEPPAIRYAIV